MDTDLPDVLRAGFTNAEQVINGETCAEGIMWIYPQWFKDFRERFGWRVAADESPQS